MNYLFDNLHSVLKNQHAVLKKQQSDIAKSIAHNIELTLEVYPYTTEFDEKNNTSPPSKFYPMQDTSWDI